MAGFYVDVDDFGQVVAPEDAISPDSAREGLYILGLVIRTYAEYMAGTDWTERFREDWDAAAEVQEALKSKDHKRLAELFPKRGGIDPGG
jgi:hypothetical protein